MNCQVGKPALQRLNTEDGCFKCSIGDRCNTHSGAAGSLARRKASKNRPFSVPRIFGTAPAKEVRISFETEPEPTRTTA